MLKGQKSFRFSILATVAFVFLFGVSTVSAQLTGPKAIPGDYASVAAAVTDLNTQGVGAGGVTFTVADGHVETAPVGGFSISNPAGNGAGNPIVFQRGGGGVRPSFTASAALTVGSLHDAIFEIIGTDNITIDGFEMLENPANIVTAAATNTMTEWGVAILYATTTNGSQNVTIQNCVIDLNRTYPNTFGIYSNSTHTATGVTTSATATTAAGGNDNLRIYTNSITDVNFGVVHVGPTAAADLNPTVDIGGIAAGTGNSITNFGTTTSGLSGYANVSVTINGVLVRNTRNFNVSYNTIASSNGGITAGTVNGIQIPASSSTPTGTLTQSINNNNISLRPGASLAINGINMPSGSVNATTTVSINNNDFNTFGHTVAATSAITFITHGGNPLVQNMNGNTFTNISVNTTGAVTFFSHAPTKIALSTFSLSGNSIVTGFTRTGAGATTVWSSNASSVNTSANTVTNNNFSNITLTGASAFTGMSDTDGASATSGPTKNISGNTFNNITTGAGTVIPMSVNFAGANSSVNNNTISNITTSNSITCLLLGSSNQATLSASGNSINTIGSGGTAVVGISVAGIGATVSKSKIYDLSGSATGSLVTGIANVGTTTNSTITLSNNLIGNLTSNLAIADDTVRGIAITASATTSNFNVYYNTVYLNALAGGANFGSTGIFHVGSSSSTTSRLDLRNNIITNTSVRNGSGATAAYRRSGAAGTLANYASTSNNNLFYAGTPGASNVIYVDSSNVAQTLAAYKAGVFTAGTIAPRDSASVTENPTFISTSGSNANFLHINTATPTQIESGGIPVAGITDDFDGNTRNVTTPDIGADEFAGTLLDLIGPTITYTNLANTASTGDRVLTTTITDATGVPISGVGLPVIYYRKNADPYASTQCSHVSGSTYDCFIVAAAVGGLTAGDAIFYYVAAQDTAGTPNVSVNPSAGAAGLTANPPAAATPPTTPNSYLIAAAISGTLTADGVGGGAPNFASLTNPGGVFEYINNNVVTGNITVNITADLLAETGTHALNAFDAPYTVTIVPTGAARIVSGAAAATALIRTNGASRVTIDGSLGGGGTDRSLTISNTSVTTPQVVRFGSIGATAITANTLKNVIAINGVNTSSAVVVLDNAGTAGTFNNITIQNNDIQRAFIGIFTNATVGAGNGANLLITQNKLDTSGANAIRLVGVYVQGADGATVSNNTIGNFEAVTAEADTGIWLASGTVNSTVSGNTVSTIGMTTAGSFFVSGIRDSGGSAASGNSISGNTITDIVANSSNSTLGPGVAGIEISSGGTIIQRNNISGVNNTNTTTFGVAGIDVSAGNNVVIRNNFVSGVTGNMTGGAAFSTTFGVFGIRIATGTGHQVLHNSVNMYGLRAGTATTSLLTSALCVVSTASTGMDIRNNIFANNITGGTTSVANVAVYLPSGGTSAMNLTDNNNSYYFGTDVARSGAGQAGTTAGTNFFTTLSALAAYSSTLHVPAANDNASLSSTGAVPYITSTDLHISATATEIATGAAVGVTIDYDNDPRPASAPDIGADEIVQAEGGVVPAGSFYNASFSDLNTLAGNVSVSNTLYLSGVTSGGTFTTSLGCSATVSGAGPTSYVNGTISKGFCTNTTFSFPVGDVGYTPVEANVTLNTVPSSLTVRTNDFNLSGFDPNDAISRNWQIDEMGDLSAILRFWYLDADVTEMADEIDYRVWRRQGDDTLTAMCPVACVDDVNNILGPTIAVTDFSRWTGSKQLAPTSSAASVGGRVVTANGQGIRNAAVVITGNSLPTPRVAKTGSFGYFQVDNLDTGQTYVITVVSKRFRFAQPSRVLILTDSINDADFVADPLID